MFFSYLFKFLLGGYLKKKTKLLKIVVKLFAYIFFFCQK